MMRQPAVSHARPLRALAISRHSNIPHTMPRPSVCVVSRVAGLSAALSTRGLTGPWLRILDADKPDMNALASAEVLVGEPALCGPLVDQMPQLEWLQSTFAGCNQLLTASERRDYTATRLAGCFGASSGHQMHAARVSLGCSSLTPRLALARIAGPDMAEYTMLHILALEREYDAQRSAQAQRIWHETRAEGSPGSSYRRLPTLTLGVLGLGDIGSDIARTAAIGHRMKVIGCRRNPAPRDTDGAAGVSKVYGLDQLSDFLGASDYIVSVLPSTPQTRGMLDGGVLAGAAERTAGSRPPVLINVGRGDLLSEATILEGLDKGWLSHFVGDVYNPEPLAADSPLWLHPKVTVTPHNSAVTQPSDVVEAFAANLDRFEEGGVNGLHNIFNWEAGY